MNAVKLTIFTPTYNRSNKLLRCFDSIKKINTLCLHEIEWLVIDDGSIDDTSKIISEIKNSNKEIKIKYIYQVNSGKQAAWNKAVDLAEGYLFLGLDSDDQIDIENLSLFIDIMISGTIRYYNIAGIRALSTIYNSDIIPNKYFNEYLWKLGNWKDEYLSNKHGDRIDIFYTDIIRDYKYPVEEDVKFIPESWFYANICQEHDFLYTSKKLGIIHDDDVNNRLSKSTIKNNAMGNYIARSFLFSSLSLLDMMRSPIVSLRMLIRLNQTITYIPYSRLYNDITVKEMFFTLPGRIFSFVMSFSSDNKY